MQREAIIRGPAIVTWNSLTFYTKGDIAVTIAQDTFDVESGQYGKVDERVKGRAATVKFTPAGKYITGLWPYGATAFGASIYGSTDRDLVVLPLDASQNKWTFYNASITKMPGMFLGATKTIVGEVEFTALGKENTLPSVADSLFLRATNTFNDTSFAPSELVTQPYGAAWGAVWTGIETVDGWTVDFNMSLEDVVSDAYGVVDKILTGLAVTAKAELLSVTEAQLVTALGIDKAMGASLSAGADLVLTGTGVTVTVKNAQVKNAEPKWGLRANRLGVIEFVAMRKFTTGAPGALFTVA